MEEDEADSEVYNNDDDAPMTVWSDKTSDGTDGTPYVSKKKKVFAKLAKQQRLANGAAAEPLASTSNLQLTKPASDSRDGKGLSKADGVDDSKSETGGDTCVPCFSSPGPLSNPLPYPSDWCSQASLPLIMAHAHWVRRIPPLPTSLPPAASLRKIITTLPFSNGYSKQKLEYPLQSSDFVYPELTVLSSADVSQDLEFLLQNRRHSTYDSRDHRSSTMNAHPAGPSSQPAGFEPPTHYDAYGRPTQPAGPGYPHHSVSGPISTGNYPYLPGPPPPQPGRMHQHNPPGPSGPIASNQNHHVHLSPHHPLEHDQLDRERERELELAGPAMGGPYQPHTTLTSVREGMEDRRCIPRVRITCKSRLPWATGDPSHQPYLRMERLLSSTPARAPSRLLVHGWVQGWVWGPTSPMQSLIGQNEEDILLIDLQTRRRSRRGGYGSMSNIKGKGDREFQREKDWIMQEQERQKKIRAREREWEKRAREKEREAWEMDREREKEQLDIDQLDRQRDREHCMQQQQQFGQPHPATSSASCALA
ncbi:hypothetical protein DFP72DRAFT_1116837 [Ephemerocybe angulata]|uniref:Uncharacterized protein n=1 Tax=Ephemerocybe angulata TaxID=980116 RepID=A0A8H6I347_9AGAR|nr:hypothetical protein DFP72DRAFT_1116837 [Tulosesus angulatus]